MDKENYLARRYCLRQISELGSLIGNLSSYIWVVENNKWVTSKKGEEALSTIIDYKDRLEAEKQYIYERFSKLMSMAKSNRKKCNHEILIRERNSGALFCPFCTSIISSSENSLVIEKDKFHGYKDDREEIYDTIEYLINNKLDFNYEEFVKALKIVVPKASYDLDKVKGMKL